MSSIPNLSVFLLAALILLITPGPAVLYIIARSIDQGRRAGLVSVLSIEVGNFCHVLAATFGLTAILQSSGLAFSIVKYLGAAYLVFLGIRRLLAPEKARVTTTLQDQSLGRTFSQGILVAILNPKTALFFFAFLPQFVDPNARSLTLQLLTLGCIFVFMAIITDSIYALLAGTARDWLNRNPLFPRVEKYIVGFVYIALGVLAAMAGIG